MKKYVICDNDATIFWGYSFNTYKEAKNALRDGLQHGPACVKSMQIMTWRKAAKRSEQADA